MTGARPAWWRAGALALLLVLALLPWWGERAWVARGTVILLLAIGVVGQNLLIGYAGLISLGQAGFLAVGAYAFAHLRILGAPFPLALAAAGGAAGLVGWLVGFPSLRLKGPYLAIATLGFATVVVQVLVNVTWLSGGRTGLALPPLDPPRGIHRDAWLYLVYLGIFLVFTLGARNLVSSWVGRAFVALRDAEPAAATSGVDLATHRLLAFAISSLYTGVSGALLAQYLSHLEPQSFSLAESMSLFVGVVVGGLGSIGGSVAGAAFVVLVPALAGSLRGAVPVIFGAAILATLALEPRGLAGLWARLRALVSVRREG